MPMIKELKITVLAEDSVNTKESGLIAKHGLSFLIEGKRGEGKFSLLMDTGPSSEVVLHNAEAMGRDLAGIDAIFLSHGHYDHTGGLIGILRSLNKTIPVIAHPQIFDPKLKFNPAVKFIGAPFTSTDVEASGGVLLLARNPVTIVKGVLTTGQIDRLTPFERVKGYWTIDEERFVEDDMIDDQALTINFEERGLVIVSGCAHSGIINTIRQAQTVTGVNRIYAVIGGFHLAKAENEIIRSAVRQLIDIDPEIVAPCHCTGSDAVRQLAGAFGDRCRPLRTGDRIVL